MSRLLLLSLFLAIFPVLAQPALHLKTRTITPQAGVAVDLVDSPVFFGAGHLILQFSDPPSPATLAGLDAMGITVLGGIPDNGLLVSLSQPASLAGFGAVYAAPLDPSDKISPLISGGMLSANGYFLIEFHQDVDLNRARLLIQNLGFEITENPDLNGHQLMVHIADPAQVLSTLKSLAIADLVEYIFPASDDLAKGVPSRPCVGALTTLGAVTQLIPTNGPGWGGPGQNPATVGYVFSALTNELAANAAEAEIQRAMAEWSKIVQVTWKQSSDAIAPATVNVLFASGSHGDAYPFDGPGGVLAHTFYPAPPNPEPIAGDMHFDASETWNIGANTDVFSAIAN